MGITYKCSVCAGEFPRDQIVVKRVQFRELGPEGRVLKSRNTRWLCPLHLEIDSDFHIAAYDAAPGAAAKRITLTD